MRNDQAISGSDRVERALDMALTSLIILIIAGAFILLNIIFVMFIPTASLNVMALVNVVLLVVAAATVGEEPRPAWIALLFTCFVLAEVVLFGSICRQSLPLAIAGVNELAVLYTIRFWR